MQIPGGSYIVGYKCVFFFNRHVEPSVCGGLEQKEWIYAIKLYTLPLMFLMDSSFS